MSDHYFDSQAGSWTSLYERDFRFERRFARIGSVLEDVLPKTPGRVLDAGCGSGVFSRHLAAKGWNVVAFDGSPEMIKDARQQPGSDRIEYMVSNVEELETSGQFDAIVALSLLEYVDDDLAALEKLSRLLKRGGIFVLSVPNKNGVYRRIERLSTWIRSASNGHLLANRGAYLRYQRHQYTPGELDVTLRGQGMQPVSGCFLSSGLKLPPSILGVFERGWWAALYCAAYTRI